MKYFAKYIPIAGTPKIGDMALKPSIDYEGMFGQILSTGKYVEEVDDDDLTSESFKEFKLVKLFVCSSDFDLDYTVTNTDTGESRLISTDAELQLARMQRGILLIKMGEVSKYATWVKEGDEFNKEELFANGIGYNWHPKHKCGFFQVKGPCGHFH